MTTHDDEQNTEQDLVFVEEDEGQKVGPSANPWRILIVDDEATVHQVTRFALAGYRYLDRPLEFVSAHSEREAKDLLNREQGFSLLFLDVVMETSDAGLNVVKFIREELRNDVMQIIMRTGQPGEHPEEDIIKNFAINDYKIKTELTREKLFTVVTLSLRSYAQAQSLLDLAECVRKSNASLERLNASLETKVNERTKELLEKSLGLEEALDNNRSLMRILAHDLVNYVTIVTGNAILALKSKERSELETRISRVMWAMQRQIELIQRVTEFEAMRSGKKSIVIAPAPLVEMVDQVLMTFDESASTKGVKLRVDWLCASSVCAMVDKICFIHSVLNNLVSNAVKFSDSGSEVLIRLRTTSDGMVVIEVKDSGMGMPDEIIQNLFAIDKKTSRPGTKGEKGTGFGMPIVKSLLEKMSGSIEVHSKEKTPGATDWGTTFSVMVKQAA
jgi:signal transduction histidine kinase